jgi:polyisoprenoid-binding protein YceI
LNTAKNPTIVFETTNVRFLRGNTYSVAGRFTLNGVTRNVTTNAEVRYQKESDATRNARFRGDVLQVRTSFRIKLSDYGIKIAGPATGKVANDVTITLTVYGQSGS